MQRCQETLCLAAGRRQRLRDLIDQDVVRIADDGYDPLAFSRRCAHACRYQQHPDAAKQPQCIPITSSSA